MTSTKYWGQIKDHCEIRFSSCFQVAIHGWARSPPWPQTFIQLRSTGSMLFFFSELLAVTKYCTLFCMVSSDGAPRRTGAFSNGQLEMSLDTKLWGIWCACEDETSILRLANQLSTVQWSTSQGLTPSELSPPLCLLWMWRELRTQASLHRSYPSEFRDWRTGLSSKPIFTVAILENQIKTGDYFRHQPNYALCPSHPSSDCSMESNRSPKDSRQTPSLVGLSSLLSELGIPCLMSKVPQKRDACAPPIVLCRKNRNFFLPAVWASRPKGRKKQVLTKSFTKGAMQKQQMLGG